MHNLNSTISPLDQSIRFANIAAACPATWEKAQAGLVARAEAFRRVHESKLYTSASRAALRLAGPAYVASGKRYCADDVRYVSEVVRS